MDYGSDLVLIEITSGRPTLQSIVDADPDAIRADIAKLLEKKISQLGDRIRDLSAGVIELPGVDFKAVERVWPIVVNSEGLLLTPVLWTYLRDETNCFDKLEQPKVQSLTLLDLEDVETFLGLVASGNSVVDMLRSKTTLGWREREFASWYEADRVSFPAGASPYIDDAAERAFQGMIGTLLGDLSLEEYQRCLAEAREGAA